MLSFHLFLAITFSFFLYIYIAFKAPPFVSLFFLLLTFFPFSQLLLPQVTSLLFSSVMPLPFDFFHQLLFPFLPGSFSFCFASFLSAYLYFPFLCLSPAILYSLGTRLQQPAPGRLQMVHSVWRGTLMSALNFHSPLLG